MDITNQDNVFATVRAIQPTTVVHCAALVGRRECENQSRWAEQVNVMGTENIVAACKESHAKLVFISTPAVFDGVKGTYEEDDLPNPQYSYGAMKLLAESLISELDDYLTIRTDFFDMNKFKYDQAFTDHFCSKEPAPVIAKKILHAIDLGLTGLLHIGGPRQQLFTILHKVFPDIKPISIVNSSMPDFPRDFSLCTQKFQLLCSPKA